MTPEGIVKRDIKAWLDVQNAYYFMPVQTGYGKRTVDFLICLGGRFLAVEAKRAGGRQRKFQMKILDEIKRSGGLGVCVGSLQELLDYLNGV